MASAAVPSGAFFAADSQNGVYHGITVHNSDPRRFVYTFDNRNAELKGKLKGAKSVTR